MDLVFDSKSAPGCVMVKSNDRSIGVITKVNFDNGDFKKGERYFFPIDQTLQDKKVFVKEATYAEAKKKLIETLNNLEKEAP